METWSINMEEYLKADILDNLISLSAARPATPEGATDLHFLHFLH